MKLAIPEPRIALTTLNDLPIDASNNTIKALDKVKLSGEIQDENGLLISDYSGEVTVTVLIKIFLGLHLEMIIKQIHQDN